MDGSERKGVNITLRMRLECEVLRGGGGGGGGGGAAAPACRHEVLNEVVLSRGSSPYLSNIEVRSSAGSRFPVLRWCVVGARGAHAALLRGLGSYP